MGLLNLLPSNYETPPRLGRAAPASRAKTRRWMQKPHFPDPVHTAFSRDRLHAACPGSAIAKAERGCFLFPGRLAVVPKGGGRRDKDSPCLLPLRNIGKARSRQRSVVADLWSRAR